MNSIQGIVTITDLAVSLVILGHRLKQQNDRTQTILAGMGEGLYGIDLEGNCTLINATALKMLTTNVTYKNPSSFQHR